MALHRYDESTMKKNGFTLIEILIVVAIIGILATMGIVAFQTSLRRSRDATRIAEIKALQNAAEQFYADNASEYPTVDGCAQLAPYLQGFQDYNDPRGVAYECDFTPAGAVTWEYCLGTHLEGDGGNATGNCSGFAAATGNEFYRVFNLF